MAGYFFDSSALVKLYHSETGTSVVDQIANTTGNLIRISRLTVAGLTSAFAIKVRTQSISREDADAFIRTISKRRHKRQAGGFFDRRAGVHQGRAAG